ncbi:MAG: HWE histidine kinase domain-containing protein [Sphingosinicella sp.]|uniref:HWE histidine kinase domain-containing protein n=1 Tax=Sphingosinicella sp. TaxID=1917971 RepID=UPI0040382A8B
MTEKSEEQKAAEGKVEELRQEGGPFVVAAEDTRMPMVFMDAREPGNPIIFANDSFLSLTGYRRDEVLGHSFNFLMAQGTDPKALALVEAAFEVSDDHSSEVRYRRKDGSEFWAALFISPVRDESGDIVQNFASFIDLTRHKEEQAQSRMLIDELNHRVKNTLTTVQSIVAQALRNASDPEEIRESIESRLFALSRSHDLLTRENWESAGLHDVVNAALEPFGVANGRSERFKVTGENVRFPPKAALALGIAFHELATNAVKYGAFSGETGCVRIAWTIEPAPEGDRLILRWSEENGPPVAPPTKKGFGSRVIERGLALEMGGTTRLDYRPDGVICTIDIPAPHGARNG